MSTDVRIGHQIIKAVTANPGNLTQDSIAAKLPGVDRKAINQSIGRLMGKGSFKLKEINGFLFLGDGKAPVKVTEPVTQARPIVPRFLTYEPAVKQRVSVPEAKRALNMSAILQISTVVENVHAFGYSDLPIEAEVKYIPSSGKALLIQSGDFAPNPHAVIFRGKYIVLLVDDPEISGEFLALYYEAPRNQCFVLSWANERPARYE